MPLIILLVGGAIVLCMVLKAALSRIRLPALIGYLALGFLLRLCGAQWEILSKEAFSIFEFLATVGIICLLFRVGLESDLLGLIGQLRRASFIWFGNVLLSGLLGYLAAYHLLGLGLVPSLVIATAFTATSVGVAASVWQEADLLYSPMGELFVDVAEMDDVSGVIFMALLFSMLPLLRHGSEVSVLPALARTSGLFFLRLLAFGAFCVFFSRYLEQPITSFFKRIVPAPEPMLMVVGTGFIIAALAGLLGFSVAIGAFFAGLVFSRDPEALKMEASFWSVYEFFTPFFFIGIGLGIDPSSFGVAMGLGAVLLVAAVLGKILGTMGPALLTIGWTSSALLGVSMVPRAEIMMIIAQRGLKLGGWAVPAHVFSAMVVVSAVTCIVAPLFLQAGLRRWPQPPGPKGALPA